MCGIAGMFGDGNADTVAAMLDAIVHRGPDDGHLVSGADFALGARRLSIVDVAGGRQPMANEDETIWAAQNGELYNYPDLRPLLLSHGHRLTTRCDTEILPHLYEEHGVELPRHIDGMFAVCLWDTKKKLGLLARDRTGKKPLYYCEKEGKLYFASEIKALLRVPGFERRLDVTALHHFLALKHVPAPLSIFSGIRMLPPAHVLHWRPGQGARVSRYWSPNYAPVAASEQLNEDEAVDRFLELFRDAVRRRLMADVPIGFFLSGGLDSSLTTAVAAELTGGPDWKSGPRIKTFTLTYKDASTTDGKDQDRRWARWVAEHYGTEHREEVIEFTDFPGQLRRALACFDEPFAGVVSTYYLSKLISRHVKVAVSGDGADELFGSYLSHRLAFPVSSYGEYLKTGDTRLIRPFQDQPELLARLSAQPDWAWRAGLMTFGEQERLSLYSPEVVQQLRETRTDLLWRDTYAQLTATDPLNRVLEAEFLTIFPDQVLAFVDRLSMAHSLEVRTAYLDTAVVEFCARLPGRYKIKDGVTKYLLKQAASRFFPHEMVHRGKEGFLMPITQWLLKDLKEYVHDTLSPPSLARHGLFQADAVGRLIDATYAGQADYRVVNKVYALVVFQEWYDLYMNTAALPTVAPLRRVA